MKKRILTYKRFCIRSAFFIKMLFVLAPASAAGTGVDTFGIYLSPSLPLYIHDKAQVSIFSNVINDGVLGSVKGAVVNMMGEKWRNTPNASMPDELGTNSFAGTGGIFRFSGTSFSQFITGGFSVAGKKGASFPSVTIANTLGVNMENNDVQVRSTLHFENGLFSLNGNSLLVGDKTPGTITGYSDTKFVATGNTNKGGFLHRAKVSASAGSLIFPVGTQAGSYAPMSLMFNTNTPQDIRIRVFDDIYRNAFIGPKGSPASIQQTWHIGQENNTAVPSLIALQHNGTREGAAFTAHRGNSYISIYDFAAKAWDTLGPSGVTSPGSFTTGTKLPGTYINARAVTSLSTDVYLTKNADVRTDSVTIAKAALTPIRQPDGSFAVTFLFIVKNLGNLTAQSLQILDSLDITFKSSMKFSVSSVKATGNLVANTGFDGVTATDLLMPASSLSVHQADTVTLVVNVQSDQKEAYYYNSATLKGILNGFNNSQYTFNNRSVNGLTVPAPGTKPVPTPVILSAMKYQIPQGFSPNGDGVNDRFIIGNIGNNKVALWIFDKLGIYVYKNMDYKNDWDGSINQSVPGTALGDKVKDGTYFYKIIITETTTGNQETYNGFLSIWK